MNYYLRRILQAMATVFIVATLSFAMFRLMPNGPLEAMKEEMVREAMESGGQVDMQRINQLVESRANIRPDEPLHIQYVNYLLDLFLHLDLGYSIETSRPVSELLFKAMPWTVFISIYGLVLGFSTNILLGSFMAYWEGGYLDKGMSSIVSVTMSVPYYVVAIIMLAYLGFNGPFPNGGRVAGDVTAGFNWEFMASVIDHATLPILSTYIVGFGGGALSMRGNSIRVLGEDYIRVARLRGLGQFRIATRYVARNAILPVYTGLMISLSAIFSGNVILEQIFSYHGVGYYTLGAINGRDYPLMMGILLLTTTVVVTGILIADLTYGLIDPRASTEGETY